MVSVTGSVLPYSGAFINPRQALLIAQPNIVNKPIALRRHLGAQKV